MKCNQCNKENTEFKVFSKKVFWVFTVEVPVCQSCISKVFKQFRKGV